MKRAVCRECGSINALDDLIWSKDYIKQEEKAKCPDCGLSRFRMMEFDT